MKFPHTVRLDAPDGSALTLTRQLSDLQFRTDVDGGFAGGSFTLQRPIDKKTLALFSDVLIFDGRNGNQVGGGRLLTPGRTNDQSGQVAKVTFVGEGKASLGDVTAPYAVIDADHSNWVRTSRTTKRVDASDTVYPGSSNDDPSLMFNTVEGQTIVTSAELVMTNKVPLLCGMLLGGLGFNDKSGSTSSNWATRGRAYSDDLSSFTTPIDDTWDTTISARRQMTVNGDFTNKSVAGIQWKRTGVDVTANENAWSAIRNPKIRMQLLGQDRALRTVGYTNEYALAHEVFIDWVARYCPRLDIENAILELGTYQFDQLAWLQGTDGNGVVAALFDIEQGLMWGAYEKLATGKFRVELKAKPTDVRYEVTVNDGYDDPSPADELYNVAYVVWTSPAGRAQSTRVPTTGVSPVPELDALGIVRSMLVDQGSDVGSTAQAIAGGTKALAEHAVVPNGGTLTIGGNRKIRDNYTGRLVAPWEIDAGYLARIRGVRPRPDTLNPAGGPDGSTISRIVAMNWSDSAAAATLELDTYTLTVRQKIVDIVNQIKRRPRR